MTNQITDLSLSSDVEVAVNKFWTPQKKSKALHVFLVLFAVLGSVALGVGLGSVTGSKLANRITWITGGSVLGAVAAFYCVYGAVKLVKKTQHDKKAEPLEGQQELPEGQQEPAEGQQEPAEGQQEPAERQQEPAEGQQEPAEGQQEPAEGQQELPEIQQGLPANEKGKLKKEKRKKLSKLDTLTRKQEKKKNELRKFLEEKDSINHPEIWKSFRPELFKKLESVLNASLASAETALDAIIIEFQIEGIDYRSEEANDFMTEKLEYSFFVNVIKEYTDNYLKARHGWIFGVLNSEENQYPRDLHLKSKFFEKQCYQEKVSEVSEALKARFLNPDSKEFKILENYYYFWNKLNQVIDLDQKLDAYDKNTNHLRSIFRPVIHPNEVRRIFSEMRRNEERVS